MTLILHSRIFWHNKRRANQSCFSQIICHHQSLFHFISTFRHHQHYQQIMHRSPHKRHRHRGGNILERPDKIPPEKDYEIYAKYDADELRKRLIPEIVQEFPDRGLRLYGSRLPRCDARLVKNVEALKLSPKFYPGSTFRTNTQRYRIEKVLGSRSFRIMDLSSKAKYFLKLEPIGLPKAAPSLRREILVLNNAYDSPSIQKQHFLSIFDRGTIPNHFNYIILQLGDCNISDLRSQRLNGADFSRPSALHIACQTLQAIHDVHLNNYYHRDIRSGNFIVGLKANHRIIYIVNFSLSYEYIERYARIAQGKMPRKDETPRITPKFPWISCRFQSRPFHLGKSIHRLDDVESWLYLIIDIFDQKMLPWKYAKSERVGYEQKERFFMGDYAEQLGEFKPYITIMAKHMELCRARMFSVVDFSFYGNILEQMAQDWKITGKEPLDWVPDPTSPHRNISRADAAAIAAGTKNQGSSKKNKHSRQRQTTKEDEDEFNFLPTMALEPMTNEKEEVKEKEKAAAEPSNTDIDSGKKPKEKQPTKEESGKKDINVGIRGGGGGEKGGNDKTIDVAADKKDINANRKPSKPTGRKSPSPVLVTANESETKEKEKKKENEKEKKKEKAKEEEESDAFKSPSKKDDNDESADSSMKE